MSAITGTEPRTPPTPARFSGRATGVAALTALTGLAVGAGLIFLLQFIPPTDAISPLRRTISEYGLSANKGLFDAAVILVAGGSATLFAAHLPRRVLTAVPAVAGALWTVSLLVIVAFPKADWAVGPSAGGVVHRIASVVGFLCLPAGILLASGRVFPDSAVWRGIARWLGVASLLWFGVILGAIARSALLGGRWWQVIPLGLVERGMALTEILAVATLAVPLLRRT
ncbi:DUF998 domain-containing protein [Amycolatopsis pigmentata]|uniref:DUF998 domain-containing protein n=1 Tax=Amycolatopsis pigmentata TaxID=450801 RepID=A0ABW5FPY7_9PSEU